MAEDRMMRGGKPGSGRPLAGLALIERFGSGSEDATRTAVSFAGMVAALWGAEVLRVEPEGGDPMRSWQPQDDTGSVLYAFLVDGKQVVRNAPSLEGTFLITDEPDAAAAWPTDRTVLVEALPPNDDGCRSELAIMARAGLLDIYGSETIPPQPLPGHQIAYLGGLAAFDALVTAHLAAQRGLRVEPSRVTLLDVALWVNWKHFLAGWQGAPDAGLRRKEDWSTLRCKDGYVALTFQDKDMPALARMCESDYFLSAELSTRAGRAAHISELNAALESWLRHRTREEVTRRARELRLPVGPVLSPREVLGDRHLDSRAFFRICKDGRRFPRLPVLWNGSPVGGEAGHERPEEVGA